MRFPFCSDIHPNVMITIRFIHCLGVGTIIPYLVCRNRLPDEVRWNVHELWWTIGIGKPR